MEHGRTATAEKDGSPQNDQARQNRERRRARRQLRTSEIRYRRLFESARDGILILDAVSRRITEVNPFLIELLGYSREEFLGKELWQIGLLKDSEASCKAFQELQETGYIRYEHLPLQTKSKKSCEVEFISNVYVENGRQVIQCNVRDITERKQAEKESRENAVRFRFLAESMPQKIFTARPNGQIDYFNQQWTAFTGLSFEQIRDWGWIQFIHPDDLQETLQGWQQSLDTGQPLQLEHRFRRADGVYRWHLSRAHAMRDDRGSVVMWISSNTDIDDQKGAEEKLKQLMLLERAARAEAEQANRAKDDFLALVSHELRTPLTAILGWCSLLKNGKLGETDTLRALDVIPRNAEALAQLVEDVLDVSRITAGKLRLELRPVELSRIITSAVDSVRLASDAKEIEIQTNLDPDVGLVPGDTGRLEQVLLNLLSNAIKFTPKGGLIKMSLDRANSNARIKVTDTGQGISSEFLPYVFDRFRQSDNATTRRYKGLGLGLSIVRSIVEMHGGTVDVESQGTGQGSSFTVNLPLMAFHSKLASNLRLPEIVADSLFRIQPGIKGVRVLIVDDEPNTLEMLAKILERAEAVVKTSASADEALVLLQEWRPDLLISDMAMPEKDGYWLIKELRLLEQDKRKRIPAIALTAYIRLEHRARLLTEGFDMFVPKPVEPMELLAIVASLGLPFKTPA